MIDSVIADNVFRKLGNVESIGVKEDREMVNVLNLSAVQLILDLLPFVSTLG